MDTHDVLVKGTLLHDIGKICIRANEGIRGVLAIERNRIV